jgi:hypothetical protein
MYREILTHQDTDILFNMASRQFAYNPTQASISGATLVGTLAVGSSELNYSSNPGGITWWMGPEESTGYVIATVHTTSDFPTPVGDVGTVKFWRTNALSDSEFKALSQYITGQTFADAAAAKTWLNANNYWTSWAPSGVTFSQSFVQGAAPTSAVETAWNTFRAALTGSYTTFTMSSTNGSSVTATHSTNVQTLANALRNATNNTSVTINSVVWRVGTGCGTPKIGGVAVEFSNIASCSASSTVALRPMINNLNWGGIGTGSTVNQASQTITLTFS